MALFLLPFHEAQLCEASSGAMDRSSQTHQGYLWPPGWFFSDFAILTTSCEFWWPHSPGRFAVVASLFQFLMMDLTQLPGMFRVLGYFMFSKLNFIFSYLQVVFPIIL